MGFEFVHVCLKSKPNIYKKERQKIDWCVLVIFTSFRASALAGKERQVSLVIVGRNRETD